jgi:putative aminopeptidase FrvX
VRSEEIVQELVELLGLHSPTGHAEAAADYCARRLAEFGLPVARSARGAVIAKVRGTGTGPARALTAHVDTLAAIVAEAMADGRLRLTPVGGLPAQSCDGAYVEVWSGAGPLTGTILPEHASAHVSGPRYEEQKRTWQEMRVRLDLTGEGSDGVRAAGVRPGDYVVLDPRTVVTQTGFVKSRFLDDKASAAALLAAAREVARGPAPHFTTYLHFSVYEEVGQGAPAGLPDDVDEIVAVDMAAVGAGQASREHLVTICAKDSGGPYDFGLRKRLCGLADGAGVPYVVDTYPFYASDATAAARSGRDVRIGLFGPGVDASHTHERTHSEALLGTARLALAYLREA